MAVELRHSGSAGKIEVAPSVSLQGRYLASNTSHETVPVRDGQRCATLRTASAIRRHLKTSAARTATAGGAACCRACGEAWPNDTERPNSFQRPSTGAKMGEDLGEPHRGVGLNSGEP